MPYKIITEGKFIPKDIRTLYKRNKRLSQSQEALQFIETKWNEFVSNSSKAFNGRLFRVDKYDTVTNNYIELQLSDTDYKEFVGTRDHEFVNKFGKEYTANPLSVGALMVTQDYKIILGKRSAVDTDIGKNKISVIGGYLDPSNDLSNRNNKIVDIFQAVTREIYEETGINNKNIVELICIGLIDNKEHNQINLPFYTKLDISAEQIKAHITTPQEKEFSQIITINSSVQSIIQFLDTYKGQEEEQLSDIVIPTLTIYKDLVSQNLLCGEKIT
jgi:8-oxo-dGTP pyrophosphatase MutT (NUDIX family)